MKNNCRKLIYFETFSTIFAFILGTILHFSFEWSGNNCIVATFSAINESIWEHLKLIFFPTFITLIIGYFLFRKIYSNYFCSKALGIIVALLFVVIFFYTYTGILGNNYAVIDISTFFVAILIAEFITYFRVCSNRKCNKFILGMSIGVLLISFIIFTYFPPKIGLFEDPITNSFGINTSNLNKY